MEGYIDFKPREGDRFEPVDVVAACFEQGMQAVLLDEGALRPSFFDLSTGVAGELAGRLATYGIRMAGVVPAPAIHSERFQEFAREANRGRLLRFFPTREEAVQWLETA